MPVSHDETDDQTRSDTLNATVALPVVLPEVCVIQTVLPPATTWPPPEVDANRALYGGLWQPRPNRKTRRRAAVLGRRRRGNGRG